MNYLVELEVLKKQAVVVVVDSEENISEDRLKKLAEFKANRTNEGSYVTKEQTVKLRSSKELPSSIASHQVQLLECGYPYEMVMEMNAEDGEAELDAISRT